MPSPAAGSNVPTPSADQKQIAQASFAKAREAIANRQLDYAITLLLTCCKLDPGNFFYRQTLRKTQKEKYGHNLTGSFWAFLTTPRWKGRVKLAKRNREYLKVLEYGEQVLCRNPWDLGTQLDMAEAFDALGLSDLAVFTLDQAREKYPRNATLNRALARLFEKRGDFQKAIVLWQLVKETHPTDVEASHKAKDLAASETIQKGQYVEAATGSKESPVLGRIETRAVEKQDKLARDAEPLIKRIEADPTEPALYVQLANVYRRHGQLDRARATLQQGLGPTGNAFPIRIELMELELIPVRRNLEEVEARLRKLREPPAADDTALTFDPDPDAPTEQELLRLRSEFQKEILNREIEIYRAKADRFPNEPLYRLELGSRLLSNDLVDQAIVELQLARRDDKLRWKAKMLLGLCFQRKRNWRLAQTNFEEALADLPPTEEAGKKELLFLLASGCAENGDLSRALDLGHELANIDFGFRNIGRLIEEWNDRLQSA